MFGETLALTVAERRGRYYLEDDQAGAPPQKVFGAEGSERLPGHELSSDSPDRWDEAGPAAGAAVDAAGYLAATYDYFARIHGRAGALGGGAGVRATVHFGHRWNNAFWNGRQLAFGDGDGLQLAPLAGALDVVAHEYTHAVTQAAARLGHSDESGAVNEAISDLFACFVEHEVRGPTANWTVGEEVDLVGGRGLRDLGDPHRSGGPAHVDEETDTADDRGGIHFNSLIVSHAGYLMTAGGTNAVSKLSVDGIGLQAASAVWYRALTRYLQPDADLRDAADATVAAAGDLFGEGTKKEAVTAAWRAVGVLPER